MSKEVRRLFVAVDPPDDAVAHLGAVVDSLEVSRANAPGKSTRLASRDRWHVTLAFLGDVPVARIDSVTHALEQGIAEWGEEALGEVIRVSFAGGGTFGRGSFTILWAGLGGNVPALRALSARVRRELRRARLPLDTKGFRPHLTLSRPGTRVERDLIAADVETLASYVGPQWTVDAIHLVASELGPHPRHTRLATVRLSGQRGQ